MDIDTEAGTLSVPNDTWFRFQMNDQSAVTEVRSTLNNLFDYGGRSCLVCPQGRDFSDCGSSCSSGRHRWVEEQMGLLQKKPEAHLAHSLVVHGQRRSYATLER